MSDPSHNENHAGSTVMGFSSCDSEDEPNCPPNFENQDSIENIRADVSKFDEMEFDEDEDCDWPERFVDLQIGVQLCACWFYHNLQKNAPRFYFPVIHIHLAPKKQLEPQKRH